MNIIYIRKFSLLMVGCLCITTTITSTDNFFNRTTINNLGLGALIFGSAAGAGYYWYARSYAQHIEKKAYKADSADGIKYKRLAQDIRKLITQKTGLKMSLWFGALYAGGFLSSACIEKFLCIKDPWSNPQRGIYLFGVVTLANWIILSNLSAIGLSGLGKRLPSLSPYEGGERGLEELIKQYSGDLTSRLEADFRKCEFDLGYIIPLVGMYMGGNTMTRCTDLLREIPMGRLLDFKFK